MNNIRRNRIFRALTNGVFLFIPSIIGTCEADLVGDAIFGPHNLALLRTFGLTMLVGLIVSLVRDKWRGRSLRWRHAEICLHIMTYLAIASVFTNNMLFLILLWIVGSYVIVLQLVREDLIPFQGVQFGAKRLKALHWLSFIAVLTCGSLAVITANGWFWLLVAIIVAPYVSVGSYFIIRAYRKKQQAKKTSQEEAAPQTL